MKPQDKITAGALKIREAASQLTERISKFEAFLNLLPGRVETTIVLGECPDKCHIRVARIGKEWKLLWSIDGGIWKLLVEASLKVKLMSIREFPNILFAMNQSQDDLVSQLTVAVRNFDTYYEELTETK